MNFSEISLDKRPRNVAEIAWDTSSGGPGDDIFPVYIMGEKVSAGTAADGDIVGPLGSPEDGVAAAGSGSFGAYMIRQVFRGDSALKQPVYYVCCAEPAGGVAATQIFYFTNAATSAGKFTVNVAGAVFTFSIENGDSISNAADAMVAAFNLLPPDEKPPCTVAKGGAATYYVTFTMANKGAIANKAPSYVIRTGEEPSAMTLTSNGVVFGVDTGGKGAVAGTLYPTLTAPLAAMLNVTTPLVVFPWDEAPDGSTKAPDLIRAHMETKCNGENMHYGQVITCWTDTIATLTTDIGNLDDSDAERVTVVSAPVDTASASPGSWSVSTACWVAHALASRVDISQPMHNIALPYQVRPPAAADILTSAELESMIDIGCSPIHWDDKRKVNVIKKLVCARLFNTYPKNHVVIQIVDYTRELIRLAIEAACTGKKLGPDGETNVDENTITPAGVLDVVHDVIFGPNLKGKIRNRETLWLEASAAINAILTNRVDYSVSVAAMDAMEITAGKIRERRGFYVSEE